VRRTEREPRRAALLLAVALAAFPACRHVPPDPALRAAFPAPEPPRIPEPGEIRGVWVARAVRGGLSQFGHAALYVFGAGDRYGGALASDEEATPIEGTYGYDAGVLTLDGGALVFEVRMSGDRLQLSSAETYLELERLAPGPRPPAEAAR
jgi:hypothetical protein